MSLESVAESGEGTRDKERGELGMSESCKFEEDNCLGGLIGARG